MGEDEVGNALEERAEAERRAREKAHRESPRGQAELVLGKAVHSDALDRLFELIPEAVVTVEHVDDRHDGVDLKVTRIQIDGDLPTLGYGSARCRLDCDNWDRRRGIAIAFRRALAEVPR